MDKSMISPAAERNKGPILDVLQKEFSDVRRVLEIGSGTGQHARFLGAALPHLIWQTSDLRENHDAIAATLQTDRPANVLPPLLFDVEKGEPPSRSFDAVFSANTAHIMSIHAVECMFNIVGRMLPAGGIFCLYGPFNFNGTFSSESNVRFDASLRQRQSSMGIRDIEELDRFAGAAGMSRVRLYAMPANNHIAVWQKGT